MKDETNQVVSFKGRGQLTGRVQVTYKGTPQPPTVRTTVQKGKVSRGGQGRHLGLSEHLGGAEKTLCELAAPSSCGFILLHH